MLMWLNIAIFICIIGILYNVVMHFYYKSVARYRKFSLDNTSKVRNLFCDPKIFKNNVTTDIVYSCELVEYKLERIIRKKFISRSRRSNYIKTYRVKYSTLFFEYKTNIFVIFGYSDLQYLDKKFNCIDKRYESVKFTFKNLKFLFK